MFKRDFFGTVGNALIGVSIGFVYLKYNPIILDKIISLAILLYIIGLILAFIGFCYVKGLEEKLIEGKK